MFGLDPDVLQSAIDGLNFGLNSNGSQMALGDAWLWSQDHI